MAPFWEAKALSRKAFGTPGADLGGIWDHFSPPWIYLDICWSPLGPVWALLGINFGPSGPLDLLREVILRPLPAILGRIPSDFYCLSTSWSQFGRCAPPPLRPFAGQYLEATYAIWRGIYPHSSVLCFGFAHSACGKTRHNVCWSSLF